MRLYCPLKKPMALSMAKFFMRLGALIKTEPPGDGE